VCATWDDDPRRAPHPFDGLPAERSILGSSPRMTAVKERGQA
jgi:hypothetical protein